MKHDPIIYRKKKKAVSRFVKKKPVGHNQKGRKSKIQEENQADPAA